MRCFGTRIEKLEPRALLCNAPVISEFQASAVSSLDSDWVEIYNPCGVALDLHSFYLSDDVGRPKKWRFPEGQLIRPGEYSVVHASGNDRADDDGTLHANFSLDADGESVVLSAVDGFVDQLFAEFPRQETGISYGRRLRSSSLLLTSTNAESVLFDDFNDLNWTLPQFSDGDATPTPIGYELHGKPDYPIQFSTDVVRVDFQEKDVEFARSTSQANWNAATVPNFRDQDAPITKFVEQFGDHEVEVRSLGGTQLSGEDGGRGNGVFDRSQLSLDSLVFDRVVGTGGMGVTVRGLDPNQYYQVDLWSRSSMTVWDTTIGPAPAPFASPYAPPKLGRDAPVFDETFLLSHRSMADDSGEIRWELQAENVSISGLRIRQVGVVDQIATDIGRYLHDQQSGARLRYSFSMTEVADSPLQLNVTYDAGFIAYLNGTEIARRNVDERDESRLNVATATFERAAQLKSYPETIDVSRFADLIRNDSKNILAVHGFNSDQADPDFLLGASLEYVTPAKSRVGFFSDPTPGLPNATLAADRILRRPVISESKIVETVARSITISSLDVGADLIYTSDGSLPTEENGERVESLDSTSVASMTIRVGGSAIIQAYTIALNAVASPVASRTFAFVDDVMLQGSLETPLTVPIPPSIDIAFDSRVFNQAPCGADPRTCVIKSLSSLPSVSLTLPSTELWGDNGIYGPVVRRDLDPMGFIEFNGFSDTPSVHRASIEIQGNSTRRFPQKSFRVSFNNAFGSDGRLHANLFDSDLGTFNQLALWNSGYDSERLPTSGTMLRDYFISEVSREMQQLAIPKRLVHVYLNGNYWGVYTLLERVDEAFLQKRFGDNREFDIIKDSNVAEGSFEAADRLRSLVAQVVKRPEDTEAYQRILGNNPDGTRNPEFDVLLDVDNFIDFMLLHIYGSNEDFTSQNWIAYRDRSEDSPGFRFLAWDQEGALESHGGLNGAASFPKDIFGLAVNEHFRIRVEDRIQKHFVDGNGILSPANAKELWDRLTAELRPAILADIARWGDVYAETKEPLTFESWQSNVARLRDNYFDGRWQSVTESFVGPVSFILDGRRISLNAISGRVYFTFDRSDPRAENGEVNLTALEYESPFEMPNAGVVKARAIDGAGNWSAIVTIELPEVMSELTTAGSLRISEVHYNPETNGDTEFVELINVSDSRIDLQGLKIVGGIRFEFPSSGQASHSERLVDPNERIVIAKDVEKFSSNYDTSNIRIVGEYAGSLSNSGDAFTIVSPSGQIIQSFEFHDGNGWPISPDGLGPSLQAISPRRYSNDATNWRASAVKDGTPGQAEKLVGDANLDGVFDSSDLILVFQNGRYENRSPLGAASWSDGDWNGDGLFTSSDFVLAFQFSEYGKK
ncbi:CotH kinase family protein [Planctomycetota bacterium]